MKKLALAAAFAAAASQAFAGGMAPVVVEPIVIVDEHPMAMSSGSNLIVPLILIALIALAASGGSNDPAPAD